MDNPRSQSSTNRSKALQNMINYHKINHDIRKRGERKALISQENAITKTITMNKTF